MKGETIYLFVNLVNLSTFTGLNKSLISLSWFGDIISYLLAAVVSGYAYNIIL